ncbi:unnamed protein product [Bursaphelenchus okinawaensis]|uniref:Uncharacterized protein n=1 Tax=Bursaphelenchus okinawaensis TaxID=465554 RepID=A0A811LJP9_9BILA|nr:unnamed protein product [Bursaphelenchus okinawaensis]CAG9123718.1 unnamed protein product [Bursaphelenchus okinawaensis]
MYNNVYDSPHFYQNPLQYPPNQRGPSWTNGTNGNVGNGPGSANNNGTYSTQNGGTVPSGSYNANHNGPTVPTVPYNSNSNGPTVPTGPTTDHRIPTHYQPRVHYRDDPTVTYEAPKSAHRPRPASTGRKPQRRSVAALQDLQRYFQPPQQRTVPDSTNFNPAAYQGYSMAQGYGTQHGFGTNAQGFGTNQKGFGTNHGMYGTNVPFGTHQQVFGTNHQNFGTNHPTFGPNGGYGTTLPYNTSTMPRSRKNRPVDNNRRKSVTDDGRQNIFQWFKYKMTRNDDDRRVYASGSLPRNFALRTHSPRSHSVPRKKEARPGLGALNGRGNFGNTGHGAFGGTDRIGHGTLGSTGHTEHSTFGNTDRTGHGTHVNTARTGHTVFGGSADRNGQFIYGPGAGLPNSSLERSQNSQERNQRSHNTQRRPSTHSPSKNSINPYGQRVSNDSKSPKRSLERIILPDIKDGNQSLGQKKSAQGPESRGLGQQSEARRTEDRAQDITKKVRSISPAKNGIKNQFSPEPKKRTSVPIKDQKTQNPPPNKDRHSQNPPPNQAHACQNLNSSHGEYYDNHNPMMYGYYNIGRDQIDGNTGTLRSNNGTLTRKRIIRYDADGNPINNSVVQNEYTACPMGNEHGLRRDGFVINSDESVTEKSPFLGNTEEFLVRNGDFSSKNDHLLPKNDDFTSISHLYRLENPNFNSLHHPQYPTFSNQPFDSTTDFPPEPPPDYSDRSEPSESRSPSPFSQPPRVRFRFPSADDIHSVKRDDKLEETVETVSQPKGLWARTFDLKIYKKLRPLIQIRGVKVDEKEIGKERMKDNIERNGGKMKENAEKMEKTKDNMEKQGSKVKENGGKGKEIDKNMNKMKEMDKNKINLAFICDTDKININEKRSSTFEDHKSSLKQGQAKEKGEKSSLKQDSNKAKDQKCLKILESGLKSEGNNRENEENGSKIDGNGSKLDGNGLNQGEDGLKSTEKPSKSIKIDLNSTETDVTVSKDNDTSNQESITKPESSKESKKKGGTFRTSKFFDSWNEKKASKAKILASEKTTEDNKASNSVAKGSTIKSSPEVKQETIKLRPIPPDQSKKPTEKLKNSAEKAKLSVEKFTAAVKESLKNTQTDQPTLAETINQPASILLNQSGKKRRAPDPPMLPQSQYSELQKPKKMDLRTDVLDAEIALKMAEDAYMNHYVNHEVVEKKDLSNDIKDGFAGNNRSGEVYNNKIKTNIDLNGSTRRESTNPTVNYVEIRPDTTHLPHFPLTTSYIHHDDDNAISNVVCYNDNLGDIQSKGNSIDYYHIKNDSNNLNTTGNTMRCLESANDFMVNIEKGPEERFRETDGSKNGNVDTTKSQLSNTVLRYDPSKGTLVEHSLKSGEREEPTINAGLQTQKSISMTTTAHYNGQNQQSTGEYRNLEYFIRQKPSNYTQNFKDFQRKTEENRRNSANLPSFSGSTTVVPMNYDGNTVSYDNNTKKNVNDAKMNEYVEQYDNNTPSTSEYKEISSFRKRGPGASETYGREGREPEAYLGDNVASESHRGSNLTSESQRKLNLDSESHREGNLVSKSIYNTSMASESFLDQNMPSTSNYNLNTTPESLLDSNIAAEFEKIQQNLQKSADALRQTDQIISRHDGLTQKTAQIAQSGVCYVGGARIEYQLDLSDGPLIVHFQTKMGNIVCGGGELPENGDAYTWTNQLPAKGVITDLDYGPGIVQKLRERFAKLSSTPRAEQQINQQPKRRFASVEAPKQHQHIENGFQTLPRMDTTQISDCMNSASSTGYSSEESNPSEASFKSDSKSQKSSGTSEDQLEKPEISDPTQIVQPIRSLREKFERQNVNQNPTKNVRTVYSPRSSSCHTSLVAQYPPKKSTRKNSESTVTFDSTSEISTSSSQKAPLRRLSKPQLAVPTFTTEYGVNGTCSPNGKILTRNGTNSNSSSSSTKESGYSTGNATESIRSSRRSSESSRAGCYVLPNDRNHLQNGREQLQKDHNWEKSQRNDLPNSTTRTQINVKCIQHVGNGNESNGNERFKVDVQKKSMVSSPPSPQSSTSECPSTKSNEQEVKTRKIFSIIDKKLIIREVDAHVDGDFDYFPVF